MLKLIRYGVFIDYKRGNKKKIVDVLSRRDENGETIVCLTIISFPTCSWLEELKLNYSNSVKLTELRRIENHQESPKRFSI